MPPLVKERLPKDLTIDVNRGKHFLRAVNVVHQVVVKLVGISWLPESLMKWPMYTTQETLPQLDNCKMGTGG